MQDTWVEQGSELERDVRATGCFTLSQHGLGAGLVRMASNMRDVGKDLAKDMRIGGGGADGADKHRIKIVMVHENDRVKGGCEFGTFFGTTPQSLINEGIYKEIAIALHTPPHRAVSLALVAQALGATKVKAKQRQATTSTLASPASSSTLEQDGTMADV